MTLATLLLVLASAVVHATWNLWAKQIRSSARSATIAWLLTVLAIVFYAPFAAIALALGEWRPTLESVPWIAGSAVIHVVYFLVLLRGYRLGDLSLVYPVARGTGPLWAAAGAVLLLGERPSALSIAGALLVALGVVLVTTRPRAKGSDSSDAGIVYGLLTGFLIGFYTLWDGWAVKRVGIPPLIYYCAGELIRVVLYAPFAFADPAAPGRLWREQRRLVVGIAALSPLSYILMLLALRQGAVSHVAPAREISILIGAWLGGQVLGEGDRVRRLAAAAAFLSGVVALAFA